MEVHPGNTQERFFTVAVLLVGLIVFSSFLSSITAAATNLRSRTEQQAIQEGAIRRFLTEHSVSVELGSSISFFLQQQRKALLDQRKLLTRQLKNESRKRRRTLSKSARLSNKDLVEVLQIRQNRAVAKAQANAAA